MKNLRMKNGFIRLSDSLLSIKAGTILKAVSGNPHFPSPSPSLAELEATIDAYSGAVVKAMDKGLQQIAVKNQLKAVLVAQLHTLANYVLYCAAGDVAIARSSGFVISEPRSARPPLTNPEGLVLTGGFNRGELLLKLKRVPNVQSYRYEITEHPATAESKWNVCVKTVSKNLFTGLVSGKEYCCRVAAVGIKNQVVYSGVVSRIVL
jgi:hypothetical protein